MAETYEGSKKSESTGAVNAPALNSSLTPRCRSIRDAKQARSIVTTLEQSSRERNIKNARIMARYNSEKPYAQADLNAEGLGWKSNFTTKPLPMLIDKVAPRFVKTLEGVKYLTNAALPDNTPGSSVKTEAFRREITKTVRSRPGWSNFISEVAQENALFGYTAVAWLDEFSWFPKHFRQDSFNVPTGTNQLAKNSQVVTLRETFLIHELFELIENKDAAATAGWNVKNTVAAINSAMPEDRRSKDSNWERVHQDLARESNVALSHEAGARVVTVWHVLAAEITGKVSHYILTEKAGVTREHEITSDEIDKDSKEILFEREDRFESMSDALSFFSFQVGNGKLHGSKGIGREIYAMAGMLDRARNEVVDRLNLAGKLIIQGDDKALRRFKMSVVGNALLIGQGYNISERKIDAAVEPFMELDQFLTGLLDQMAGATTPKAFEGERVTKAAVDLFAAREEESRDNIIGRFLTQFAEMMTTMQKRLCDPNTSETDAKEMQERLLAVMSREELDKLAKQPVAETVKDYTEIKRQQIVIVAAESKGNPLYNQKEIERRKLQALLGDEFAEAVLLPDEDPTVTAEQTRNQQLEMLILIGQAAAVPVSPRDNHMVHLEVMAPAMESAATEAVAKGVEGLAVLQALNSHAQEHFKYAQQQGLPQEKLAPVGQFLQKLDTAIKKLNEMEDAAANPAAAAGIAPPGPPQPGPAAPAPVPAV